MRRSSSCLSRTLQCVPLAVVFVAASHAVLAQAVPRVPLGQADARFAEPFDRVSSVRELRDGRVIVSDPFAKTVSLADFKTGKAVAIGREGQGPGEFAFPGALVALPGDTTLLVDIGTRRFLVIDPSGKPTGLTPFPGNMMGMIRVKGADQQGRIYMEGSEVGARISAGGNLPDSTPVLRWDRAHNRIDTVGTVKTPTTNMSRSGNSGAVSVTMRRQPFSAQDEWTVAPDGRIGVVRTGDYHAEWWNGAAKVSGPAVAYQKVPVSQADKDLLEKAGSDPRSRITMTMGAAGGAGRAGGPPPPRPAPGAVAYPEFKPPFREGSAAAAPDGTLWVQRYGAAGTSPVYDVFDSQARLVKQVALPKASRVVGFGATSVYVVETADDELETLVRYRRP